ncbi:MAG TPA: penicillin acylase family protein [Burkholderiales bacterium]
MRTLFRLVGIFLAILVVAATAGFVYLRQSLPAWEGELEVPGLHAPVEILRDRFGVPHIFARSERDAHFALGFVHAQDRLWQMEMNRRVGAGRLAEALGRRGLETDRFLRTVGVRRAAQANLAHLDQDTRRHLDAYAAGVNAFIGTNPVLPPEFLLTHLRFESWQPVDSVTWLKMMAWDLGGNWRNEILRMRLSKTLPLARIQEFLPPYPGDAPLQIRELKELYGDKELPRIAEMGTDPISGSVPISGSNSWAVAKSASGKPLLANDPHLGLTAPPVWYLAHLEAPGLSAIGGTLPGVPGVLIGRNARIAWGFTNTGPDVQDLYLEKIDSLGQYLTPEGSRPFAVLTEQIQVKGEAPQTLEVRISRHGPVISDVSRSALEATPRGYALALQWTALAEDDLTMQAALGVSRSQDWQSFLEAAKDLHAPQQTATYADAGGNIGLVAAGRVPLRKPANDLKGLAPAPGWDARYDWSGYIPFAELPRAFNPPGGAVVSANHKIVPPGYKHHISVEWQPPYRARRIEELLSKRSSHSVATFASMQLDAVSLAVRELLPLLLTVKPATDEAGEIVKMLAAWDGTMAAGRPEPLIVTAWWRELARALYADELGEAFQGAAWAARAVFIHNALKESSQWCDDVRSPAAESCDSLLAQSLEKALLDLKRRYGGDPREWTWGEAHPARHRHRPFGSNPWLARFFDIAVPSAGDAYTINVGRSDFADPAAPFASRHAASYRAIYDLADPQASLFIQSAGQSGNPLSPHYRAFAEPWARGEYIPMVTDRSRLEAEGAQRLVLMPRK